jgi:predicted nuclease of restriction endonuclease-like (RecB) superfamily
LSDLLKKDKDYSLFILDIKSRIQAAQIKAAVSVNRGLLQLYWEMAEQIVEKQKNTAWGDGFLTQMANDLQAEFPGIKGFSKRNLEFMRQWYCYWQLKSQFVQQLVSQIPWGHNLVILNKTQSHDEALYYVRKTIENNWSRSVLTHQIEGGLFKREGKAITNFEATLPKPQFDLAIQTLKDPYNFDFLTIRDKHDEKELEGALVSHVTKFLLELGAGFSFIGRQHKITVDGDDFYIDLLFYHVRLHCYIVVELKALKFKPEFAGKLNFYISAVDGMLKSDHDNPTVGILICKSKKKTVVEYALKDVHKPIGVSEYQITQTLPDEFKSSLPSIAEIEAELEDMAVRHREHKKSDL